MERGKQARSLVVGIAWLVSASSAFAGDGYVDVNASNRATGTGGVNDSFCNITAALTVALDGDATGATISGDPTGDLLDVDRQFADPATGDFSLAAASPRVDAGDPALAPAGMDVGDNPRLLDGDFDRVMVVDMGAREFDHVRLVVTGNPTPGSTLTFTSTGRNGLPILPLVGAGAATATGLPPRG